MFYTRIKPSSCPVHLNLLRQENSLSIDVRAKNAQVNLYIFLKTNDISRYNFSIVDGPCSCWLSNQVNCLHTCGSDSRRNAFTTGSDGSSCDAFSEILRISDRTDLIDDDSTSTRSTCCNQLRWSSSSTSENGTVYVSCSSLDGDVVEPSPSCGFLQNYDVPRNASMREFGRFMNDTSSLLSMSLRETTAISDNDGHYSSLGIPSFQLPKDFDDCTSSKLPSSSSTCSSSESGPSLFTTSPSLAEVDINNVVERYSRDGINHYAIPRKANGHSKVRLKYQILKGVFEKR